MKNELKKLFKKFITKKKRNNQILKVQILKVLIILMVTLVHFKNIFRDIRH